MKTTRARTLAALALAMLGAGCADGSRHVSLMDARSLMDRPVRVETRTPLEDFRQLLQGVGRDDSLCALRLVAFTEHKEASQCMRLYARLLVEQKLEAGQLQDRAADLHHHLAISWHLIEPRSLAKARANVEALARAGMTPAMAESKVLRDLVWMTGADVDMMSRRPREAVIRSERKPNPDSDGRSTSLRAEPPEEFEAHVWAGGSDRLLTNTGVLAFLMNDRGEPAIHGCQLWIRNEGTRIVSYSVPAADAFLRELRPGQEASLAVGSRGKPCTGVNVTIRRLDAR